TPGANLTIPEAGDFDTKQPFSCAAWVKLTKDNQTGSLVSRIGKGNHGWDLNLQRGLPALNLLYESKDDALRIAATEQLKVGKWTHVAMTYDGSGKAGGVKMYIDGVQKVIRVQFNTLKSSIR